VTLFDTSVLVAALIDSHRHHGRSLKALQEVKSGKIKGLISQHTVAELYSSLTSYPANPRLSPAAAESLIAENVLKDFQIVELKRRDYQETIKRVRERNLHGGVIYDALILQAALKKKARQVYTWNVGDFQRLAKDEIEISEP
jgi:predicted nucleic acid-binding protein